MRLLWESRFRSPASGVTGVRGIILVGPIFFPVIGRGGGYKRIRAEVSDRDDGAFEMIFDYWTNSRGIRSKALRILGKYSCGSHDYPRICVHPANDPISLTGCISPGMKEIPKGVTRSRESLGHVFNARGGWRLGESAGLLYPQDLFKKK